MQNMPVNVSSGCAINPKFGSVCWKPIKKYLVIWDQRGLFDSETGAAIMVARLRPNNKQAHICRAVIPLKAFICVGIRPVGRHNIGEILYTAESVAWITP